MPTVCAGIKVTSSEATEALARSCVTSPSPMRTGSQLLVFSPIRVFIKEMWVEKTSDLGFHHKELSSTSLCNGIVMHAEHTIMYKYHGYTIEYIIYIYSLHTQRAKKEELTY